MLKTLNLAEVHPALWDKATSAYVNGDPEGFVYTALSNQHALALVTDNLIALKERGIYEACLLRAFTGCRVNNQQWPDGVLRALFHVADKRKLREAGDPVPDGDSFVLYRGIAGHGRARRPYGYSWTRSIQVASWFARRLHFPNPSVITTTVEASQVLAYSNARNEDEFIIQPTAYKRVRLAVNEMSDAAVALQNAMEQRTKLKLVSAQCGGE